nr:hypothetical protein CFP56_24818 [Quercus suber]
MTSYFWKVLNVLQVLLSVENGASQNFWKVKLGIPILSHDIENLSEIRAKRFSVKPWLWRVSFLCSCVGNTS